MPVTLPAHLREPRAFAAFRGKLAIYADKCLRRDFADADDLAQEALMRVLSENGPEWDQGKEPDYFRFVAAIVSGLAANERRRTRKFVPIKVREEDEVRGEAVLLAAEGPTPEEATGEEEERSVIFARLEAKAVLPRDADVLKLAACIREGMSSRIDQAKALGCGMSSIVMVRRRLIAMMKEIRSELEDVAS